MKKIIRITSFILIVCLIASFSVIANATEDFL